MEVILIKDMENLGYANDIVNVKPGYANNYLIPQGIAKAATASAKKVLAENLRQRAHKDAKILADAQALAETIANLPLSLAVKAEEGKLFGTVTAADLAEALAAKGITVDRKQISVDAIKTVGEYEATARLHKEVKATINSRLPLQNKVASDSSSKRAFPRGKALFFVFIGPDRHAARPERLCLLNMYGGSVVRNPATTQTGGTKARSPLFRHCVRRNPCRQNRSKASPQRPEGEGLPGAAPIPRVPHPASNRTPGCLPH